ncbi:hypothetical protein ACK3SF_02270 [Candidatus Nanosalina sp. VS9-1]|uniref:hypothetical protein n=1 Tax=Candidatus Nanosalina sp. VS9-1 TaxID=3388566 RepID=UPI0039DFE1EE
MIPKRDAENQADVRLRFLELLILISTLLVSLTGEIRDFTNIVFLGFLVFSIIIYVFLIHRLSLTEVPILAICTGATFSWVFSNILILQNPVKILNSDVFSTIFNYGIFSLYFVLVGLIVAGGLVSKDRFELWIDKVTNPTRQNE